MIKYFFRHYWRYLAMALAFATISFFINSCEVKAETLISSGTLGYYAENSDRIRTIYSGSGMWANQGRGYLTFNIIIYTRHTNTSQMTPLLRQVKATSNSKDFMCDIGSTSLTYNDSTEQFAGNVYTVVCDMEMGSSGLNTIETIVDPTPTNAYWLLTSQLATFDTNVEVDIASRITAGVSILNGKMDLIIQAINQTRIDLANTINSDASQILQAIQAYAQQNHQDFQTIIEQNKVCNKIDYSSIVKENYYLNSTGSEISQSGYGITNYIDISNAKVKKLETYGSAISICYYDDSKTLISCSTNNNVPIGEMTFPTNTRYFRATISKNQNKPTYEICKSGNQALSDQQSEINNNITDSSTDDPSGDISDMNQNEISNSVISDLLLLPINMFQNILNAVNGSCSSFSLGALFGTNLVLPCINLESLLGSTLWGVIDVLFCGIFVLSMRKKFVDIFENITSLKDRGNELE